MNKSNTGTRGVPVKQARSGVCPPRSSPDGLLCRMALGEKAAFVALVRLYQSSFLNIARRMLGDSSEAEDVVQRAFLSIYVNAASYRPDRKASTWLYRILTNECIDTWRKRRREWALGPARFSMARPCAGAERADLRSALLAVPPEARSILLLAYCEGLSYREIAEARGVSINTVKTQLRRAKGIIRSRLDGEYP